VKVNNFCWDRQNRVVGPESASVLAQEYVGPEREFLIAAGTSDNFLKEQLKPENFMAAAEGDPKVRVITFVVARTWKGLTKQGCSH
jgi:hypothetical protein